MTHKVPKSLTMQFADFDGAAHAYAAQLSEWCGHMKRVVEDAQNPRLKPDQKAAPYPKPQAHPDVVACVNEENFSVDYEVYDDLPSEADRLPARKMELFAEVTRIETEQTNAIFPPAKRRFVAIRRAEVQMADLKAAKDFLEKNDGAKQDAVEKHCKKCRNKDDASFDAADKLVRDRVDAVTRWAAKQHHDIEDLTVDNIDSWKMEPLP